MDIIGAHYLCRLKQSFIIVQHLILHSLVFYGYVPVHASKKEERATVNLSTTILLQALRNDTP